ncbi:type IV secretion protein IcmG [Candidiatus Paracoxiella cheracis]|uniref:type IV secretion protein IcmG n=1 Tax=Candidiatus Paracoxiella cheracis TaxID=3405120 RepID=UPI003BF52015
MTKHDEHKSTDDDYQYPNEEYVDETTPEEEKEETQTESRANFIIRLIQNNKRVTVVVVLVIVALIAFKIMGHHSKPEVIATSKPAVQQPIVQPEAPQTVAQTAPSTELMDQLGSLKQSAQENQNEISQLQNQISDLRTQLSQANSAQTQLNQSVVMLVQQIKQLTTEAHQQPVKKVENAAPPPPPLVFHLKAVVPGRAWIVSNDGLSESVSVGDTIPQYGTVKVVDADRGMVLTSSGKVIGYGENDH